MAVVLREKMHKKGKDFFFLGDSYRFVALFGPHLILIKSTTSKFCCKKMSLVQYVSD